jgi:GNAT superfamily N-acetyltransferase
MQLIVNVVPDAEFASSALNPLIQPLSRETWNRHAPRAHYQLLRDDLLAARCSIWTDRTPVFLGEPAGIIGHYAAADPAAGAALLNHAVEQLRNRGFRHAIGPMDENTWRHYRLMTQRGSEPAFFLEPDNPDDWPEHFAEAGFRPLAQYFSALNDDLSVADPRVPPAIHRLAAAGVYVRPFNLARAQEDLKAVHELSVTAFANNFLYTPIAQAEFLQMYESVLPHIRPELVLLAEQKSELIGFVFGLPDLLQAKRGQPITTAIAKTVAVRPGRTGAGLGSVLVDQFQQAARQLGFTRVIHALMHQDNTSRKISDRFGKPFRQYTLYIQDLRK